jgi:nucleoside-diphosphate-sugar epimerase
VNADDARPVAAITGAYGYLGSLFRARLDAGGWRTLALVRTPRADDPSAARFDLGRAAVPPLDGVDVLVHCAYDPTLVRAGDVARVNVAGAERLLTAAHHAGVRRVIHVSSMSAYVGTTQTYGNAKLAIERTTHADGGCSVRPGVVYGTRPGGMAGALQRVTKLPVVPVLGERYTQYTVHEDDLAAAVAALAAAPEVTPGPVSVAHPTRVSMRTLLEGLARAAGRRCRTVPVPWRLVYGALRAGEVVRVPLPFRADSLLGLVRPAPGLVGGETLAALGVTVRPF